jgi:RNA polymerase sigma factor (sigma-70 family)
LNVIEEDSPYLREEIREFVKRLNPDDRELLESYLENNLTSSEIADRLGEKPATVRQRKARLLAKMHAYLNR